MLVQLNGTTTCFFLPVMDLDSTSDLFSLFRDGKLKTGIYKIQNIRSDTYLDIHQHSNEVCCRPARELDEGRGLVRPYLPCAQFTYLMVGSGKSQTSALDMR